MINVITLGTKKIIDFIVNSLRAGEVSVNPVALRIIMFHFFNNINTTLIKIWSLITCEVKWSIKCSKFCNKLIRKDLSLDENHFTIDGVIYIEYSFSVK